MSAVAAVAGMLAVVVTWWMGPGLFGSPVERAEEVVPATVTKPASCSEPHPEEMVHFEHGGEERNGTLSGCGHRQDEQVRIAVPVDAGEGIVEVRLAATTPGFNDPRRPVGLALLAVSCLAGAVYAYLVVRGPRRRPALI
ncbi:hypothetical protein [Amycolatopsis arida]|uniref:hypothetical protein n=1 Tax=Amycolatopsis arida TaxID=587909 RepID=UPI001FB8AD1B|nr:hypothetical protein [Amycolatopsis arida]